MNDRYLGKTVAFLTQHGKESLIGPVLQNALGCTIFRAEGYDTDLLGTFSGETQRLTGQLETARRKARIGMEITTSSLGMASEGAFMPDPFGGLIPWNIEILVWIDDENQLEIIGMAQGPAISFHRAIRNTSDLEKFALEASFPGHHLTLRPESETDPRVRKGLSNKNSLELAFAECLQESNNKVVYAENDHRAFCNPTRQSMIRLAAEDLVKKIQSYCPSCTMPGFSITEHIPGLRCSSCGSATKLAKSYVWRCSVCCYQSERSSNLLLADPSRCDFCNP